MAIVPRTQYNPLPLSLSRHHRLSAAGLETRDARI